MVRSYIDDVESTYETPLEYINVTLPPQGGDPNKLLYVRVDGTPTQASCTFEGEIKRPIRTTITGDKSTSASFHLELWILADTEPSRVKFSRYTQECTVHFENLLPRPVTVHLAEIDGASENKIVINPGEKKLGVELRDREPDAVVSSFRILAS
jgi:hypothetical protein